MVRSHAGVSSFCFVSSAFGGVRFLESTACPPRLSLISIHLNATTLSSFYSRFMGGGLESIGMEFD